MLTILVAPLIILYVKCVLSGQMQPAGEPDELVLKYYKIACELNYEYWAKNESCYLKAVNRDKSTIQMDGWLKRPIRDMEMRGQLYQYYSQFRPFLFKVNVNLCAIMDGTLGQSYLLRVFMSTMKGTNALHPCPFEGHIYARDVFLDVKRFGRLPIPLGRFLWRVELLVKENSVKTEFVRLSFYVDIYNKPKAINRTRIRKQ